jgi:transposase-like protein
VPAVVPFDGLWLREHTQTETITLDKRQRQRKKCKGKKVVVLVALGWWTDGTGKREILDWHVAERESKTAWEPLVHRLWERGRRPEAGRQAVVRDGCGE